MTLNKKILKKPNHWITMIVVCTITCLNSCNCGSEGKGGGEGENEVEMAESSEKEKNTSKPVSNLAQNLKAAAEASVEAEGNKMFDSLKGLSKQSVPQKATDKQEIEKLITALPPDQKIMFNCYLAAVDIEEEAFIDLFANVTKGKDQFEQSLIPSIKKALAFNSQLGGTIVSVSNTISNKENDSLTEKERNYLSAMKEILQRAFINPLTKAAAEQAKN